MIIKYGIKYYWKNIEKKYRGTRRELRKRESKDIGVLEEIKLGSRKKEKLKNKLAEGDKETIKDPTTRLLGFISTSD